MDCEIYCDLKQRLMLTIASVRVTRVSDLGATLGIAESDARALMATLERARFPVKCDADEGWGLVDQWLPLDPTRLASSLAGTRDVTRIECHAELTSTSDYLATQIRGAQRPPSGTVCFAEAQTAGRGRNGRRWVSPPGCNINFSFYREVLPVRESWSGLSVAIGVAIAESLSDFGACGLQLKWPNDLVCRGAKLGGVLVELTASAGLVTRVVVGVGLNTRLSEAAQLAIDQPATDLAHSIGTQVNRSEIAAATLRAVSSALSRFEREGLKPFMQGWVRRDALAGKSVVVATNDRTIEGIACGIDLTGALQLRVGSDILTFASGEVTVRSLQRVLPRRRDGTAPC